MATCGALSLPTTAIAHHRVFYRSACMLNPFGPGYDLHTTATWLSNDPSLLSAILFSVAIYWIGRRLASTRRLVLCSTVAFMPLALWIWGANGTSPAPPLPSA